MKYFWNYCCYIIHYMLDPVYGSDVFKLTHSHVIVPRKIVIWIFILLIITLELRMSLLSIQMRDIGNVLNKIFCQIFFQLCICLQFIKIIRLILADVSTNGLTYLTFLYLYLEVCCNDNLHYIIYENNVEFSLPLCWLSYWLRLQSFANACPDRP